MRSLWLSSLAGLVACQPLLVGSGPDVGTLEPPDPCTEPTTWYEDVDGDGYGVRTSTLETCGTPEAGWSLTTGDCDDEDAGRHPGAIETCEDEEDLDCSGLAGDSPIEAVERGVDADGDGFRDASKPTLRRCEWVAGTTEPDTAADCDDTDATVYPGADDPPCDGVDQACTGVVGEVARAGARRFTDLDVALRDAGDRLEVCPGTYHLDEPLERGALTLTAARGTSGQVVFEGDGERVMDVLIDGHFGLERVTLRGGRTDGDGAGLRAIADSITLAQVRLEDHVASGSGGGAHLTAAPGGEIRVTSPTIEDSHAGVDGGALVAACASPASCTIYLGSVESTDTSAGRHGGFAAILDAAVVDVERSTIQATTAVEDGGALYLHDSSRLSLSESSLSDSQARRGGLVAVDAGFLGLNLTVLDSTLSEATASEGGLLWASSTTRFGTLLLLDSTLSDGNADRGGLVALSVDSLSELRVQGSTLQRGAADRGAALLVDAETTRARWTELAIASSQVVDNTGDAAVRFEDHTEEDAYARLLLRGTASYPSAWLRNLAGGLVVPPAYIVEVDEVELGSGADDNGPFDLAVGDASWSWDGTVSTRCASTGCR